MTPPSSLVRAHAPGQDPPTSLGCPSVSGSVQVVASLCWELALPGVISAHLSPDAWTSTPAVPLVHTPVTSQRTSAFAMSGTARHSTLSVPRLPYGRYYGAAVILFSMGEIVRKFKRQHERGVGVTYGGTMRLDILTIRGNPIGALIDRVTGLLESGRAREPQRVRLGLEGGSGQWIVDVEAVRSNLPFVEPTTECLL
jgi:hypothetical protein